METIEPCCKSPFRQSLVWHFEEGLILKGVVRPSFARTLLKGLQSVSYASCTPFGIGLRFSVVPKLHTCLKTIVYCYIDPALSKQTRLISSFLNAIWHEWEPQGGNSFFPLLHTAFSVSSPWEEEEPFFEKQRLADQIMTFFDTCLLWQGSIFLVHIVYQW